MTISEFLALPKIHESLRKVGTDRWQCLCPAHADSRTKSLCIAVGNDGKILLDCKAGCKVDDVCRSLGIKLSDLFPVDAGSTGNVRSLGRTKPKRNYPSIEDAGQEIAKRIEAQDSRPVRFTQHWAYHNADGTESFVVLRFDYTDGGPDEKPGKTFRPICRNGSGYIEGDPPGLLPLYGLPILAKSGLVTIHEGEKSADAARSIGLCATTSAHGSESPDKTDWRPVAGRDVAVFPDNDDAGRHYADRVTAILLKLRPLPKVKIIELPGLPEKGDMVEFVQRCREANQDDAVIRRDLDTLIARTPLARAGDKLTMASIDPFMPFPLDALPEPVRSFVADGAKAIGCDPSFIAVPLLVGLTAAIGNTRRIELKRGWTEPAIMWAAVIADSGTLKSPALELALRAVRKRQHSAMKAYAEEMKRFQDELLHWEKNMSAWKHSQDGDDPPAKPVEPTADRCWCDDTTMEALAVLLLQNWRGLLLVRDELSGWLGSFDRYSQGKGADAAKWLEMFGGRSMMVDRKSSLSKTIYVPRAAVSVVGSIQPEILRRALGVEHRENGLAARLLLACPPRQAKRWTEADITPDMENRIEAVFDKLYDLEPTVDQDGEAQPVTVPLSIDGKAAWVDFYNEHAQEQAELTGDLAATWSKLEGYAARLALVIHFVRWPANDAGLATMNAIDAKSIKAGVQLSRWFGNEARRVYAILGESNEQRDQRRLIELIQRKGGSVTVRDLMRSARMFPSADVAEQALNELVKAGHGHWETPPIGLAGGHPTRRFVLAPGVDTDTTLDSSMVSGVVSTSTVATGMDYSDEQEERAAILEYDGNLPRQAADERAFRPERGA